MLYGLICVPARKTSCSKAVVLATSVMFDVSSFPPSVPPSVPKE